MKIKPIFSVWALALLLGGCSLLDAFYPKSELEQLRIVAEVDANQTMATALDLVFVYDKTLIPLLPKSGPEWFAKKKSIVANQPASFVVVSLEVPPGMVMNAPLPKRSSQAWGVFLFANYLGKEGQFPVSLGSFTSAEIRLKSQGVEYAATDGK